MHNLVPKNCTTSPFSGSFDEIACDRCGEPLWESHGENGPKMVKKFDRRKPSKTNQKAFVRSFWAQFVPQMLFCGKKIWKKFWAILGYRFFFLVRTLKISQKMSKFYIFALSILTLNKVFPPSKSRISDLISSPKPILSGFLTFSYEPLLSWWPKIP